MEAPENQIRRLDDWLESALEQYTAVQPHPALERRIAANVRAEERRVARRRMWTAALAAGAVLAVAFAAMMATRKLAPSPGRNAVKEFPAAPRTPSEVPRTARGTNRETGAPMKQPVQAAAAARIQNAGLTAASGPRHNQFPSRRPLSEQDRLLLAFIREAPRSVLASAAREGGPPRDLTITALNVLPLENVSGGKTTEERK
jgi:hypothetical protein